MREHPIEGLMSSAMTSIQDMIDVNTIIGDPIEANNNIVIIPISKVCFGFAAGGSEFNEETVDEYSKKDKDEMIQYKLPFGGGSGAGVSINPIAFLVVKEDSIKLLPISHSSAVDKILDYIPDLFERISSMMGCKKDNIKDESIEEILKKDNNKDVKEKIDKKDEKDYNDEDKKEYIYEYENNEIEEDD